MVNIHPSLLPLYRGLNTHRRVLGAGDTHHGASVHFVTADLDSGPVVLQSRVPVPAGRHRENRCRTRWHQSEHIIYPKVIGWIAQHRLVFREGRGVVRWRALDEPMVETSVRSTRSDCRALGGTVIWLAVASWQAPVRAASAAAAAEDRQISLRNLRSNGTASPQATPRSSSPTRPANTYTYKSATWRAEYSDSPFPIDQPDEHFYDSRR